MTEDMVARPPSKRAVRGRTRDRRVEMVVSVVSLLVSQFGLFALASLTRLDDEHWLILSLLLLVLQTCFTLGWDAHEQRREQTRVDGELVASIKRLGDDVKTSVHGEQRLMSRLVGSLQLSLPGETIGIEHASAYLAEPLVDLMERLEELRHGSLTMHFETPEQLWMDHMRCLRAGTVPSEFRATCLINQTDFVLNAVFEKYCDLSYELTESGHITQLRKIFIVRDMDVASVASVRRHLEKIANWRARLGPDRLDFRICVVDRLRRLHQQGPQTADYMIFGDALLVRSLFEEDHLVNGVQLISSPSEIAISIDQFGKLFSMSMTLEELKELSPV